MRIKKDDVQYYYFWKAKIKVIRSYKALQKYVFLSVECSWGMYLKTLPGLTARGVQGPKDTDYQLK